MMTIKETGILILILLLSTTLAVAQNNDDFANAIEIQSIQDYCSGAGSYNTLSATPDEVKPSKWSNGPNSNVWFKFVATSNEVSVLLEPDGMKYPRLSLHESIKTEIISVGNDGVSAAVGLSRNDLTIGNTYYVNISNGPNSGHKGGFTLCIDDHVTQDFPLGALEVTHSKDNCSALEAFNTRIGTPDGIRPSKWSNGPNANIWFKFQATSTAVSLLAKVDGAEGNMTYPKLALYDDLINEMVSISDKGAKEDVGLSRDNLTIGNWYYVNVDNGTNQGHRGTFTLCISTETSSDYPSGAIELTELDNYCSPLEAYTTQIGTPDGTRPSAWTNGPNANVWFTFVALGNEVSISVNTDGEEGTLRYPKLSLHDNSLVEKASIKDAGSKIDIDFNYDQLTVGQRYYINVDNGVNQGHRGTFTLCINNQGDNPPIPVVPLGFTANVTDSDRITLTWNETPNQDGFEIVRAIGDGTILTRLSNEISADSTQFIDDNLLNGTTYNYQIRSYIGTDSSTFSPISIATTPSIPEEPTNFLADGNLGNQVTLNWVDQSDFEEGFEIYRKRTGSADFDLLEILDPNTEIYVDSFHVEEHTSYDYRVRSKGQFDTYSSFLELSLVTNFHDDDLDGYHEGIGDCDDTDQTIYPGAEDIPNDGIDQNCDGIDATTDTNARLIKININSNGATSESAPWNNLSTPNTTLGNIPNLMDTASVFTGIRMDVVDLWNAKSTTQGVREGDILYPDNVMRSYYRVRNDTSKIEFSGLDPNLKYTFRMMSSFYSPDASQSTNTKFEIGDKSAIADFINNTRNLATISNVTPTSDSLVVLKTSNLSGGKFGYLNAIEISFQPNSTPSFDFKAGAIELTDLQDYCSPLQAYSNEGATPDGLNACNDNEPKANVWFKFTATTEFVKINLNTHQEEGTIRYPNMTLWDSENNLIICNPTTGQFLDIEISSNQLIAGNEYFLSVDNRGINSELGTFTLCIDDQPSYNFKSGAILLTNLDNWCSSDAQYTNRFATPDEIAGSCWTNGPNNNVWFKFQATQNTINVGLKTNEAEGTMNFPYLALFDSDYNELACKISRGIPSDPIGQFADIRVESKDLIVGEWYFISVDSRTIRGTSTFSLCVDDELSNDFFEGASIISTDNYCSGDGILTLGDASPDGEKGSCWNNGPNFNKWFKFQAKTDSIHLQMIADNQNGNSVNYPYLALYNASQEELNCSKFTVQFDVINLSQSGLTIGDWYYISVDAASLKGTSAFNLCVDDGPELINGQVADEIEFQVLKDFYNLKTGSNVANWPNLNAIEPVGADVFGAWAGVIVENGDITQLHLNFGSGVLTGDLPESVGQLTELTQWVMVNSSFTGTLPSSIGNLIKLEDLSLSIGLEGELPASFSELASLKNLNLSNNSIQINAEIAELMTLKSFQCQGCDLGNTIPQYLMSLPNLEVLNLQNASIEGELPDFSNLPNLRQLFLENNRFIGSIHPSILSLTNLTLLKLNNNQLDSIPNFSAHPAHPNLIMIVSSNFLSFDELEENIAGWDPAVLTNFRYNPQLKFTDVIPLDGMLGENITLINDRPGGAATDYDWERWNGTAWESINTDSSTPIPDANFGKSKNFTFIPSIDDNGAKYRCRMTSSLATGTEIFSSEYQIRVRISKTYRAISNGDWSDPSIWADESNTGQPAVPTKYDQVIIDDFKITVTADVDCRLLDIEAGPITSVLISGQNASLTVNGKLTIRNNTAESNKIIQVINGGKLECK